jgi:hypothetical protein
MSLVSSGCSSVTGTDEQCSKQKSADGAKLAEIRMVSQQSETKTVVVEVHRSEEVDDSAASTKSTPTLERLTADKVRDKINHSCHVALIIVLHFHTFICQNVINASGSDTIGPFKCGM